MARDETVPHGIIVSMYHHIATKQQIFPRHRAQQSKKIALKDDGLAPAHIDQFQQIAWHFFRKEPSHSMREPKTQNMIPRTNTCNTARFKPRFARDDNKAKTMSAHVVLSKPFQGVHNTQHSWYKIWKPRGVVNFQQINVSWMWKQPEKGGRKPVSAEKCRGSGHDRNYHPKRPLTIPYEQKPKPSAAPLEDFSLLCNPSPPLPQYHFSSPCKLFCSEPQRTLLSVELRSSSIFLRFPAAFNDFPSYSFVFFKPFSCRSSTFLRFPPP